MQTGFSKRGILMAALAVCVLALGMAAARAQNYPNISAPQKPVPPAAPAFTNTVPPVVSAAKPAFSNKCGLPYPCRLQAIIDRTDWQPVLDALTKEMRRISDTPQANWSSARNNHKGYVQLYVPPSSGPVCREFEIFSYMGATTGKEKVTACRQADGSVTVK